MKKINYWAVKDATSQKIRVDLKGRCYIYLYKEDADKKCIGNLGEYVEQIRIPK